MVAAWDDNNTDINYLTTGTWGWTATTNTTLYVAWVKSSAFWKQTPTTSINPGDDMESDIENLTHSLGAWYFSDMLARFKAILPSPAGGSTYVYDNQISSQKVDQSDKEYVSEVIVYGNNGIIATALNTALQVGVMVRPVIMVDYSLLTVKDAQTRANNALIEANQYQNQYTPSQILNVGAELFDVVTVINQGNNTSGINNPTRVYAQTIVEGGGSNKQDYSIEISTGNI